MRIFVVLRDPLDTNGIRYRCGELVARGHEVAVCYVSAAATSLQAGLERQRHVTAMLREALAASAEAIPVFVASDDGPDGIGEYARQWGAAEIHR